MAVNNFKLKILSRAKLEVNEVTEYYESKSKGLGKVQYCSHFTLKKFPYTIHFTVDENEKIVFIQAVTSNNQNPNTTRLKL